MDDIIRKTENKASKTEKQRCCDITKEEAMRSITLLTTIPLDLDAIQPLDKQVWNCDEVGIDPN
eukprot:14807021-Ditylum_brightwellii.AAC.1